jgi:hypothetical protein
VGRSLLAAPFLVLLQQLHESRGLLSASPAVRDAMTRAGLDIADLGTALAQTEAAATDAELTLRAAHTEVDLVEVARAAWRTDAVACLRAARLRANLLDRADQAPLREAVLQLTRSHGARRFASLVEALTTLRGLVDAHHRVADGWGDPVVAAVDPLLHTARDLAAQSERAARTRADASRAATEVRSALQQVLRRLRAAWDLARLTDPHLEPLPATTLRDHAPRTRGRPGVTHVDPRPRPRPGLPQPRRGPRRPRPRRAHPPRRVRRHDRQRQDRPVRRPPRVPRPPGRPRPRPRPQR